jgi:hypothetical protein
MRNDGLDLVGGLNLPLVYQRVLWRYDDCCGNKYLIYPLISIIYLVVEPYPSEK